MTDNMQHLSLMFAFILFAATSINGENKTLSNVKNLVKSSELCSKSDGFSSCTSDCKGRTICRSGYPVGELPCPESAPYCNPKTLTCAKRSSCSPTSGSVCSRGYIPDLQNCQSYYYCDGVNKIKYNCFGKDQFDPISKICKTNKDGNCINYNNNGLCYERTDQYIPYHASDTKFVHCGANNQPVLLDCPKHTKFDIYSATCQFRCQYEGLNPDPFSDNSYYNCSKPPGGVTIVHQLMPCPTGTKFDEEIKICIGQTTQSDEIEEDNNENHMKTSCGLHNTQGLLKSCRIDYASTSDGILDTTKFKKNIVVSCLKSSDPQVIFYDCDNADILKDCQKSGSKNGVVEGCHIGVCLKLSRNLTHISYDCRN